MRDISGLVAWVTGAGTGIGAAAAVALAASGVKVVLTGRRAAPLEETAQTIETASGTAMVLAVDVVDRAAVGAAVARINQHFGPVDVLFNNHGVNTTNRDWQGIALDAWDQVIDTNIKGVYNCAAAVLPSMRVRKDGLIITTSSMAGKRYSRRAGVAYGASKHAVMAVSELLNLEESQHGIRACAICPAEVNTAILDRRPVPVPQTDRARLIQPEDIAEAVVFVSRLDPRVCVNEILITPTHKRTPQPGEPG